MLSKFFHGQKKYFSFAILSILALFIIGIITPVIIRNTSKDWQEISKNEGEKIEAYIYDNVLLQMNEIIASGKALKEEVRAIPYDSKEFNETLIATINEKLYDDYSIAIADSTYNLEAWNTKFKGSGIFNHSHFNFGEIFFTKSYLNVYLGLVDTVKIQNSKYFVWLGLPVEKEYKLQNKLYEEISFKNFLSQKFHTTIDIDYSEYAEPVKRNGKYSFQLLNNFKNKIGLVSFESPSRETYFASIEDTFNSSQSILIIFALIFIALGAVKSFYRIKSKFLKWFLISVYFFGLRFVFYLTGVPVKFIKGNIVNPAYFSSTFGGGIVKSPLEFFISALLLISIFIVGYRYILIYKKESLPIRINPIIKFIILLLPLGALYFLLLRALGASIKSVIFDSSLLYFNEPSLLPDSPIALMQLGVLILGISVFIATTIFLIVLFKNLPPKFAANNTGSFVVLFIVFQMIGIFFDLLQREPQGTPTIRIIFIMLSFFITYAIFYLDKKSLFNFLLLSFAASVTVINLLSFYNAQLEKESIKTTAYELTLRSENWLEYLIFETLNGIEQDKDVAGIFTTPSPNIEAEGFKIWSKSPLQKQFYTTSIGFLNTNGEFLGGFDFQTDRKYIPLPKVNFDSIRAAQIFKENFLFTDFKIIRGIAPIKSADSTVGFFEAAILFDINNIEALSTLSFLTPSTLFEGAVLPSEKLKIFNFLDGKIKNEIGGYSLSDEEKQKLLSAGFTNADEAWLEFKLKDENHLFFVLKTKTGQSERLIAVALKEKDISFGLFDFFKVLFIHTVFILAGLLVYGIFRLKDYGKLRVSFRSWLMTAFLIVALIPLVLLAVYLRNFNNEKNSEAILYKLNKRAISIKDYVNSYLTGSDLKFDALLTKAANDLKVDFTIYRNQEVVFSSFQNYFDIGLFPVVMNPTVYKELVLTGLHEFQTEEKIEKLNYDSYYVKADFNGQNYIIQVNDLFNYIQLPAGGTETDIFLFVSYSLAVILIIILSSFLSNQISSPIRKLTIATKSVATGDLSIEIDETQRGEIQELIDGFNYMVKELQRNQVELAGFEREAAWKEMAKQVAHEIKNPLTPMKLAVQQLMAAYRDKSSKFDEIFGKVTNMVISQIEILKNIASEFSSFARMPNLNMKEVNLSDVINDSVNLFIEEKVKFELKIEAENSIVQIDIEQMKRTIINLIRNAIQAGAYKIIIRVNRENERVCMRLSDNGKGIPSEILDKIFDENFTTKQKGMGIGLTIARKFIESIGSIIRVEQTSPSGTTFLIVFAAQSNG
ncbi:MAG: ATP-binding protein [bacterium]